MGIFSRVFPAVAAAALAGSDKLWGKQGAAEVYMTPAQIETYIASLGRTFAKDAGLWYPLAQSSVQVSHTGDSNLFTFATVTVPANSMGPNGRLRCKSLWSMTNSVNNKTIVTAFGATSYLSTVQTTIASLQDLREFGNVNATNAQKGPPVTLAQAGGWGSTASAVVTSAIDTTAAVDVTFKGLLANSGETLSLESYIVELLYGA